MYSSFDHILLLGFGGPEKPAEIMPFLRQVTAGRPVPEGRLENVAHHYELLDGKSGYNPWARQLRKDLSALLQKNKIDLPVFLGYRNTAPFFKDILVEVQARELKRGLGIILAPFRSTASCRRYQENMNEALKQLGISDMTYTYLPAWHDHPEFIQLLTNLVKDSLKKIPAADRDKAEILFSCHSIPQVMDSACPICCYSSEFETTSFLTAEMAGIAKWKCVYQSRSASGSTTQPAWLGPDILETLKEISAKKESQTVLVIPMGFLCDNAEVLYDLDIEAKALTEELGIRLYRAATPGNHAALVNLFANLVSAALKNNSNKNNCAI